MPTEKKPAPSSRKPPPPRRPRADEPDDESIARRRPPRPGIDDVLTAEVLEQGPRQSWTVAELDDVAKRGFGCA